MAWLTGSARSRFRPLVTAAVVGVWLVLIGVLVKERYFPDASSVADAVRIAAVESDDWFTIRIRGAYAGFGRSRQTRSGDNWVLLDELNISLNIQGQVKPIRIKSEARVDQDFKMASFALKVSSGIISFEQQGRMDGRDLVLAASQGGATRRLRLHEAPRLARSLGLPMPLTGLKVGDEFHVPIVDPLDGQKTDAEIRVMEKSEVEVSGKNVEAWLVRAVLRSVDVSMWVDGQGKLLKGRMPLGITVVRSDKDEIMRNMAGARDLPDLMALASVPVEGAVPDPTGLTLLRLEVQADRELPIPSDNFRQEVKGSQILLKREIIPEAAYSLPCADHAMEQHLVSSRFIRSDHPEIAQKAREIIGDEKDPVKAALRINSWVHDYLVKVPTPSVPDAYSVLMTRQGDCNEHAVLAVALARAVGLPARMALGLVHMNDGFYYHAWVQYWAGNRWFPGDPLMKQVPADPSHVALLYGDVEKHINVITFLGRLKLKVLEAGSNRAH